MCKSIADGGQRCLSHMSVQISPEFGEAYKDLSLAKKSVMASGGLTSSYKEELDKCDAVISMANIPKDTEMAAKIAILMVAADTICSAEKNTKISNGESLTSKFELGREKARHLRTLTQKILSDNLQKYQTEGLTLAEAAGEQQSNVDAAKLDNGQPQLVSWMPANYSEYEGISGIQEKGSPVLVFSPGFSTRSFYCDNGRTVIIKDQRSDSGNNIAFNLEGFRDALDAADVGPGKIELYISNDEEVYGHARVLPDGTHIVTVNVKDKETYPPAAAYVMNNSLVHELRHVHQAQNISDFSNKYAMEAAMNEYSGNKYEVEAWSYGQIADHTGKKDNLPNGVAAQGASVWAFLPA